MTEAQRMEVVYSQRRGAFWHKASVGALWQYEVNGFYGYYTQAIRWQNNAAEEYAEARRLMGVVE